VHLALHNDRPSSSTFAARFAEDRVLARLQALDSRARRKGVASLEPGRNLLIDIGMEISPRGKVTKNGYGLFHLSWLAQTHPEWPALLETELDEIRARIRQAHGVGLRFLVWAGMGGSAEDKAMYGAMGLLSHGPKCYVLDSTDPAKLKAILEDMTHRAGGSLGKALRSTLFVGMAMGMTSYEPVVNLEKISLLFDRLGLDSRSNLIYLTLRGSLLDQFARKRGYRKVELQLDGGNTTAGRHSGPLTRGSLYPLGLAGVDLKEWMEATWLPEEVIYTAWQLASFLHQQGLLGRDKVTLIASKSMGSAALWTKQNFEESLGKSEDLGIKIVIGEKLRTANYRAPKDPAQDRLFLAIVRKGEPLEGREKLRILRRAGYAIGVLSLGARAPLSSYMQFIHYAVFGLGWLRRMNFVTQPSVELYKAITNPLYTEAVRLGGIEKTAEWRAFETSPRQSRWRGGITLHWDRLPASLEPEGTDAASQYASLLSNLASTRAIEYGELTFFGDSRYSSGGAGLRKVLDRAAESVFRTRLKMPVDVYEGPAMNHSYHEMIIGHGRCFSTVLLSAKAQTLQAAAYTADYHRAQFLATQMALARRGRHAVAITTKDLEQGSLHALDEFFSQVAKYLKARRG
jgi:glucose-6-phosphate isomerase